MATFAEVTGSMFPSVFHDDGNIIMESYFLRGHNKNSDWSRQAQSLRQFRTDIKQVDKKTPDFIGLLFFSFLKKLLLKPLKKIK